MKRFYAFATVAVLVFASNTFAARADDQSRLAVARQIVASTHAVDTMHAVIPTMMTQMKPLLRQQGASDKMIDDFLARFMQHMDKDLDRFSELVAQVYAREFSEDDLNAVLAFYKTQAGQDLIAKQPLIAKSMVTLGSQWGQNLAKEVLDEFAKEKQNKLETP